MAIWSRVWCPIARISIDPSKSKLEGRAGTVVRFGPQSAAMPFNDGTTDRKPHTQAAGLGCVKSMEDSFGVQRVKADSQVSHGHSYLIALAALGPDDQLSVTVLHTVHSFDGVQDQVHDHLL